MTCSFTSSASLSFMFSEGLQSLRPNLNTDLRSLKSDIGKIGSEGLYNEVCSPILALPIFSCMSPLLRPTLLFQSSLPFPLSLLLLLGGIKNRIDTLSRNDYVHDPYRSMTQWATGQGTKTHPKKPSIGSGRCIGSWRQYTDSRDDEKASGL
jgi:hypothetical protein